MTPPDFACLVCTDGFVCPDCRPAGDLADLLTLIDAQGHEQ